MKLSLSDFTFIYSPRANCSGSFVLLGLTKIWPGSANKIKESYKENLKQIIYTTQNKKVDTNINGYTG